MLVVLVVFVDDYAICPIIMQLIRRFSSSTIQLNLFSLPMLP